MYCVMRTSVPQNTAGSRDYVMIIRLTNQIAMISLFDVFKLNRSHEAIGWYLKHCRLIVVMVSLVIPHFLRIDVPTLLLTSALTPPLPPAVRGSIMK